MERDKAEEWTGRRFDEVTWLKLLGWRQISAPISQPSFPVRSCKQPRFSLLLRQYSNVKFLKLPRLTASLFSRQEREHLWVELICLGGQGRNKAGTSRYTVHMYAAARIAPA